MYKPTCLVIMFNSRRHVMTLIERYVGQSPIAFIRDVAYAWTSVVHRCINRVGPKKGSSKENVDECKRLFLFYFILKANAYFGCHVATSA